MNPLRRSRPLCIAVFLTGDPERSRRMAARVRELVPEHPHIVVGLRPLDRSAFAYAKEVIELPPGLLAAWRVARRRLRRYWIGLAPFLWRPAGRLRWLPWLLAPRKLLAFNSELERHHVRLSCPIASWRFLRGEAVGDIHRPVWFHQPPNDPPRIFAGRPASPPRRRVAVVTPYLPFPLSHGGAIRIFNLLRPVAAHTDLYLFAFAEQETEREVAPLLEFCARVVLVPTPRWEPRAVISPRGVGKFRSPAMERVLAETVAEQRIPIVQLEYTQLAHLACPRGARKVLVEHDVTFHLHRQIRALAQGREKLGAWLAEARWRAYEIRHARRFDRVIAMSDDDRERLVWAGLKPAKLAVVPNGVDLERFQPSPAGDSPELLFIGSFRHFPNVLGFRFLVERVWPKLRGVRLTVVAGADYQYYWRRHAGEELPALPAEIELLGFVEDVRPLYRRAMIVLAPLVVSAGTNIKVLEALAMERPLVSTTIGVAGLGLAPGEHARIADRSDDFAAAILYLLWHPEARQEIAAAGRAFVESRYGWNTLAERLTAVWEELLQSK